MQKAVMKKATKIFGRILSAAQIPESHGLGHALKVLDNLQQAIKSNAESTRKKINIAPERLMALQLGALLHDADDRKYFPANQAYENARQVMTKSLKEAGQAGVDVKSIKRETIEMISYVSASSNGNQVPERAQQHPELLWVRWADRLEAIGTIGAVRCWQYNTEKGAPMQVDTTPRCQSRDEVWANVTPDRLDSYMSTKTSNSMMDHYFDKLL